MEQKMPPFLHRLNMTFKMFLRFLGSFFD